jgi:hypothetical protein
MGREVTSDAPPVNFKLLQHTKAIRENKISVALMFLYLQGYEVELHYIGKPNASAAKEALDELNYEGIPIWSCSTTLGSVWETWERDAIKFGDLDATKSWGVWNRRLSGQAG